MGRRWREVAIPESSPLSHPSFSPFEARRGGEGEEVARVLTLTQGRQARGPADASRLSSSCSCSLSTLFSPSLDSRQQRSSSSSSSTSGCSRSESLGGDEEVVGRGFPSLPPSEENPWFKAAAIFADMFALVEAAAAAATGMFEEMLEELKTAPSKQYSSTSTTHGP